MFLIRKSLSVEENVHVLFDDTNPRVQEVEADDDEITSLKIEKNTKVVNSENNDEESTTAEVELTTPADKTNIPKRMVL